MSDYTAAGLCAADDSPYTLIPLLMAIDWDDLVSKLTPALSEAPHFTKEYGVHAIEHRPLFHCPEILINIFLTAQDGEVSFKITDYTTLLGATVAMSLSVLGERLALIFRRKLQQVARNFVAALLERHRAPFEPLSFPLSSVLVQLEDEKDGLSVSFRVYIHILVLFLDSFVFEAIFSIDDVIIIVCVGVGVIISIIIIINQVYQLGIFLFL